MTLREFLYTCNFRKTWENSGQVVFDSVDIRIYFDKDCMDKWVDFGMYDFGGEKRALIEDVLCGNLLDAEIDYFQHDQVQERLCVFLCAEGSEEVEPTCCSQSTQRVEGVVLTS